MTSLWNGNHATFDRCGTITTHGRRCFGFSSCAPTEHRLVDRHRPGFQRRQARRCNYTGLLSRPARLPHVAVPRVSRVEDSSARMTNAMQYGDSGRSSYVFVLRLRQRKDRSGKSKTYEDLPESPY